MRLCSFTLQPVLLCSTVFCTCWKEHNTVVKPLGELDRDNSQPQMSTCAHTYTHTVQQWLPLGHLLLNEALSLRGLGGHEVRQGQSETRSAYSSELCKEVWSQCQSKSYLQDTDRKETMTMCVFCFVLLNCTQLFFYSLCYLSSDVLSNSSLYLSYFTSTCLPLFPDSHMLML